MKMRLMALLIVLLLAAAPFLPPDGPAEVPSPQQVTQPQENTIAPKEAEDFGGLLRNLPGNFIENQGQVDNIDIRFYAQGDPLSVGLTPWGVVFALREDTPDGDVCPGPSSLPGWLTTSFSMRFEGCNEVEPSGALPLNLATNFFLGNDLFNSICHIIPCTPGNPINKLTCCRVYNTEKLTSARFHSFSVDLHFHIYQYSQGPILS